MYVNVLSTVRAGKTVGNENNLQTVRQRKRHLQRACFVSTDSWLGASHIIKTTDQPPHDFWRNQPTLRTGAVDSAPMATMLVL